VLRIDLDHFPLEKTVCLLSSDFFYYFCTFHGQLFLSVPPLGGLQGG
jgi:hypothetical protein